MNDNVIHAFPDKGLPTCPVEIERNHGYCSHSEVRLIEHDREVVCNKCNATIDAFDYLLKGALAIREGWARHRQVFAKVQELRDTCEQLEKQRRRLTQQVKRLKEKAGDVVDLRNG